MEDVLKSTPTSKNEKKEFGRRLLEEREERKNKKRDLSPHVQTRIYRAPEVILLES